jgi:hypothetical protein
MLKIRYDHGCLRSDAITDRLILGPPPVAATTPTPTHAPAGIVRISSAALAGSTASLASQRPYSAFTLGLCVSSARWIVTCAGVARHHDASLSGAQSVFSRHYARAVRFRQGNAGTAVLHRPKAWLSRIAGVIWTTPQLEAACPAAQRCLVPAAQLIHFPRSGGRTPWGYGPHWMLRLLHLRWLEWSCSRHPPLAAPRPWCS